MNRSGQLSFHVFQVNGEWTPDAVEWLKLHSPASIPEGFALWAWARQTEFAMGRRAAYEALLSAGWKGDFLLPRSRDERTPAWPEGWIGSISHSFDAVSSSAVVEAAVAPREDFCALGIDWESVQRFRNSHTVGSRIALDTERRVLGSFSEERALQEVAIFAAKEALFKALFPYARRSLGFSAAHVVDFQQPLVVLELTEDWAPGWSAQTRVSCQIERRGPFWVRAEVAIPAP